MLVLWVVGVKDGVGVCSLLISFSGASWYSTSCEVLCWCVGYIDGGHAVVRALRGLCFARLM